ncbi:MAG: HAD-IIB family hydrolase [Nitrososphaeria archaeon]|jgi:HAD superfamily hydrolase (TIGR01484 family)
MKVEAMFFDYDGTLSPIDVGREEAGLSPTLEHTLVRLSKKTLIGVVTTKDFKFISRRAGFAQVLACVGGLEILSKGDGEYRVFYKYRKGKQLKIQTLYKGIPRNLFFVEEKHFFTGEVVGFCLDWRGQYGSFNKIKDYVNYVREKARKSSLYIVQGRNSPFLDVYLSRIDKGMAVKRISRKFALNLANCMYFGDSEIDNSAFRSVGFSFGVLHKENKNTRLECDRYVKLEDLPVFLKDLLISFNA